MSRRAPEPGGEGPSRDDPGAGAAAPAEAGEEAVETRPLGTLFFLMVYVMVLAGMWVTMYWLMVTR